jgi:hypothetical protein
MVMEILIKVGSLPDTMWTHISSGETKPANEWAEESLSWDYVGDDQLTAIVDQWHNGLVRGN